MSFSGVVSLRREYLEAWIERLIAQLDWFGGDPDFEDTSDPHPANSDEAER